MVNFKCSVCRHANFQTPKSFNKRDNLTSDHLHIPKREHILRRAGGDNKGTPLSFQ